MYDNSGLEDLIESDVYASGTASHLLKGKQYNQGIRAHKLVSEAFFRLQWSEFLSWLSKSNQAPVNSEFTCIEANIDGLVKAVTLLRSYCRATRRAYNCNDTTDGTVQLF